MSARTEITAASKRAHVVSAVHPTAGELLFMSELSDSSNGNPIRGGIPVLAPWFGKLMGEEPSHGWARRIEWSDQDDVSGYDAHCSHDKWQLALSAHATAEGFAMMLRVFNGDEHYRPLQLGFHPYFLIKDVRSTTVRGADKTWTFDGSTVDQIVPCEQYTPFTIDDGRRTISVTAQGSDHFVIWNPGNDADQNFADLGQGDWQRFVCVEPALLGPDLKGVRVEPFGTVSLGMTVKVIG